MPQNVDSFQVSFKMQKGSTVLFPLCIYERDEQIGLDTF